MRKVDSNNGKPFQLFGMELALKRCLLKLKPDREDRSDFVRIVWRVRERRLLVPSEVIRRHPDNPD